MAFVIWDKDYGYLNQLTTDPDKFKIGSSSLLIKDILIYLKDKTKHFDFEGSMDKGIHNFYMSFGGTNKKFYKIKKTKPKILNYIIEATNLGMQHKKKYE